VLAHASLDSEVAKPDVFEFKVTVKMDKQPVKLVKDLNKQIAKKP
jgi:hypothetical protein